MKITAQILLGLLVATTARADKSLTINSSTPFGCLQNASFLSPPMNASGSFTLPGATGNGTVQSSVSAYAPSFGYPPDIYFFNYSIDLSKVSASTSHCVRLLVHFGTPQGCDYDEVWGSTSSIKSATLAPFGDITFVFAGGCLSPGQGSASFTMFSESLPKTGIVTVIDDYVNSQTGLTNETRINVTAIVPDIPPDPPVWLAYPIKIPYAFFQGELGLGGSNNAPPMAADGSYDFTLQLLSSPSNGLAVSELVTQTVPVVKGLFNLPMPFDPISMGDGSVRWLNIGVRPSNLPGVSFTPIFPPAPVNPAPQAYYAYTAGVVSDLTPGQAVTSLNGLTDAVFLQPGNGILLGTSGNTLIISAQPGTSSDRNLKTGFKTVQPEDILARLAALPIESWRYTNEVAGVRHVGPMAQDFKAAFGLGTDDKFIAFVDEEGVALAAIQGLNQKLNEKDAEIKVFNDVLKARAVEVDELKQRLDKLETLMTNATSQPNR